MIIACPACATRYAVPDSAIGVDGRTVRCAKCRHSWFQDGPTLADLGAATVPPAAAPPAPVLPTARPVTPGVSRAKPVAAEAVAVEQAAVEPVAAPAADRIATVDDAPPPIAQDTPAPRGHADEPQVTAFAEAPSSFEHQPPFRPRRNPAKLWTMAASIFAVVALGAVAAVGRYGLPDWAPFAAQSTFGDAQPDLTLDFPPNRQDRRTLPDGTEFFGVSGTITNVGKERRSVPILLILLRNEQNRVVFSWQVTPPKRVLAPGESESVIEAVTDIPNSAKFAEIGWKPA